MRTVEVLPYNFTGFFAPIDNPPVFNEMKAGQAAPVKFSLGGNQGLNIFAAGSPSSVQISCASGDPIADVEETETAGQSSLSYDSDHRSVQIHVEDRELVEEHMSSTKRHVTRRHRSHSEVQVQINRGAGTGGASHHRRRSSMFTSLV